MYVQILLLFWATRKLFSNVFSVGSLNNDDDQGSENVARKKNHGLVPA